MDIQEERGHCVSGVGGGASRGEIRHFTLGNSPSPETQGTLLSFRPTKPMSKSKNDVKVDSPRVGVRLPLSIDVRCGGADFVGTREVGRDMIRREVSSGD